MPNPVQPNHKNRSSAPPPLIAPIILHTQRPHKPRNDLTRNHPTMPVQSKPEDAAANPADNPNAHITQRIIQFYAGPKLKADGIALAGDGLVIAQYWPAYPATLPLIDRLPEQLGTHWKALPNTQSRTLCQVRIIFDTNQYKDEALVLQHAGEAIETQKLDWVTGQCYKLISYSSRENIE